MIIIFDGMCNFCNGWVRFVIQRDKERRFRFTAAQTTSGRQLLNAAGMPTDCLYTIVLIDGNRHFIRSEAILRILRQLAGWRWAGGVLRLVPRTLRDYCYDGIARRRYRFFGKSDVCRVPDASIRDRFLS